MATWPEADETCSEPAVNPSMMPLSVEKSPRVEVTARVSPLTIAMQLAVVHGPAIFLLKVGFDEEHGKCSPGMLLTAATIRHAAEAGLERYEFLGVVEGWTSVWTDDVHDNVSLRAYPPSFRGAARFLTDAFGAARRRLVRSRA